MAASDSGSSPASPRRPGCRRRRAARPTPASFAAWSGFRPGRFQQLRPSSTDHMATRWCRLRVVDRPQDEPRLALGGGGQQVGHVGHGLLVGDGEACRARTWGRRRRRIRWCSRHEAPATRASACREGRTTAFALVPVVGAAQALAASLPGLGVHGEPPVVGRVPVRLPKSQSVFDSRRWELPLIETVVTRQRGPR